MLHRLLALALLGATAACTAQSPAAEPFQAGRDYFSIEPAQPTASGERIEVIEVFGYSCGGCASFQPLVNEWRKTLAPDVAFSYTPAVFGGIWDNFARAYYTAETMGLLDKSHDDMFRAMHVERSIRQAEDIATFYTRYGVTAADVEATMNSFAVNAKLARAKQQVPRYGVDATPTMVVAGKYRVPVPRDGGGGYQRMLDVVDYLVARERAAQTPSG